MNTQFTNRLAKVISKQVTSTDKLRPAMHGIASARDKFIATNGHILTYGRLKEDQQLFPVPGIYKIDEKQSMNAAFFSEPHSRINEQFPACHNVIPVDKPEDQRTDDDIVPNYDHHTVSFNIDNLYNFARMLKQLNIANGNVRLTFSNKPERAITFEAGESFDSGIEWLKGLIMPSMLPKDDAAPRNPFTEKQRADIEALCEAVNNTEAKNVA